jgi:hypothetical protein
MWQEWTHISLSLPLFIHLSLSLSLSRARALVRMGGTAIGSTYVSVGGSGWVRLCMCNPPSARKSFEILDSGLICVPSDCISTLFEILAVYRTGCHMRTQFPYSAPVAMPHVMPS